MRRATRVDSKRGRLSRRGLASLLAMLYLVLFSTLAVGYYAATTMQAQVGRNERCSSVAQTAAESGMQWMRWQLGQVYVAPGTPSNQVFPTVYNSLSLNINGTPNMGNDTVVMSNGVIYIPGNTAHWITLDSSTGAQFQASIAQSGDKLVCTVYGKGSDSTIARGIQLTFQKAPKASAIFTYGVASKGQVVTGGASYITGNPDPAMGSVLSTDMTDATPVSIGGKQVSGDVSITNPTGTVSYSGASIGGTTDPTQILNHIHKGVPAPAFPYVDSSIYTQYATNAYVSGSRSLNNVYIPPNTNPTFSSNTTITGVLWVQAPNNVTFSGNVSITGVIVVDNNVSYSTANQINFLGSVRAQGVQALPSSYGDLTKLTGGFVLAPGFAVNISGDFGTVAGSIIASKISLTGNATGTVQGSLVGVDNQPLTLNGSSQITVASTGTSNVPAGVSFGNYFAPLPDTYTELMP